MSLVVFSHANSFPAGTYGLLFKSLRSRGFIVKAVDKFGHAPDYPVTNNWRYLVQQLHDFATQQLEKHGEPPFGSLCWTAAICSRWKSPSPPRPR